MPQILAPQSNPSNLYNFQEFGQIVITNFADVLNAGKSVEEAMAKAQTEAEALAARIS